MSAVDINQIAGYFKDTFADNVEHAVPEFADLQRDIPFEESEPVSDGYHFPVVLRRSHGMTWAGTGTAAGSLYTLNDPVSLVMKETTATGTELTIQEDISYGVLSRASKRGEAAFGNAMDEVVFGMLETLRFYLEATMLYGQTSIGEIAGTSWVDGGTVQTFQLTKASWAAGLWAGMEGAFVDVYDDDYSPKRNASGTCEVTDVDPDTCSIELTGTEAELDAIVAGDLIVPRGAYTNWFAGLDKIMTNTGSLFGVDAAAYSLWRANVKDINTVKLTLAHVLSAVTKAVTRGLKESVCVKLSTFSWDDIANDGASARRFAESTKSEMDLGTNKIVFYGSNGGSISLEPHPMVKAGDAFVFPKKRVKRLGSTDVTLQLPRVDGQERAFFQELETKNGIRLRGYFDQCIIPTMPARMTKISDINPSSLSWTAQAYI